MNTFKKINKIYFFIFIVGMSLIPIFLFADTITVTITSPSPPQCSDALDNDSDGLIDYPDDPGCGSANDNDETNPPSCGDGSCNDSETCNSCSTDCGSCPGGGASYTPVTRVIFSGRAYPKSAVTLLKDAQVSATTIAGPDAVFQIDISGLSAGNYIFSVYSEDKAGRSSSLLTFPISITEGATTNVSGIFIAPTIAVDKTQVRRGDNLAIFGQSALNSQITISINSEKEFFQKTQTDDDGIYLYNFGTEVLDIGEHFTRAKAASEGEVSPFSKTANFTVGDRSAAGEPKRTFLKGDLKCK